MKKNPKSITFSQAAAELCVSESTVLRLVQRGTLHATKPQLKNGHWSRRILVDNAFLTERARRQHGLKAPRRKHIPDTDSVQREFERKAREEMMNEIFEQWCNGVSSPIQTATPAEEAIEKRLNAMNICLEAQKACSKDMQECRSRAAECKGESAHVDEAANYVVTAKVECWRRERTCARCAAILAACCILQILFGVFYILCNHNII